MVSIYESFRVYGSLWICFKFYSGYSWINKFIANRSPNIKYILMIDRQVTLYAHINKHTRTYLLWFFMYHTLSSNYESNQKVFMGTSVCREEHTILYRDYLFSKTLLKGYTYHHVNIFIQIIWIRTCPWKLFLGYHI